MNLICLIFKRVSNVFIQHLDPFVERKPHHLGDQVGTRSHKLSIDHTPFSPGIGVITVVHPLPLIFHSILMNKAIDLPHHLRLHLHPFHFPKGGGAISLSMFRGI